jgi:hypothetical protein
MTTPSTTVLIKRSTGVATPSGLKAGELAYSYLSNTMFIGDSTGTSVANVGGLFYTSQVDAATAANTASTLVRRDTNGAFFGQLYGNANSATVLQTSRDFSISGGDITATAVSFNGSNNVVLSASLDAVPGLTAGVYGGATTGGSIVPVITVGANGRILAVTTQNAGSSFHITDGTSSNTVYGGTTLTFTGTGGVTTNVSGETLTFGTDTTVLRSNTSSVGVQTIGTDLNITGNVTISGTTTTVNSTTSVYTDSLLQVAANNTVGDVIDIGFFGNHGSVSGPSHITGLIRDASTKDYYLFDNVDISELSANVITSGVLASNLTTLHANTNSPLATITQATITTANVSAGMTVSGGLYADSLTLSTGLTAPSITDSGLTATRMTFAGTGGLLSDSSSITTDGTTITAGGFSTSGGVSAASVTDSGLTATRMTFAGTGGLLSDSSSITTDGTTITAGGFSTSGGVSAASVTDSGLTSGRVTFAGTGGLLSDSSSFTFNAGTGALSVTSLTLSTALTVGNGGTGATSFTSQGIVYGNGTGAMQVTAAAGVADIHVSRQLLTVDGSGNPVWTDTLDGGSF